MNWSRLIKWNNVVDIAPRVEKIILILIRVTETIDLKVVKALSSENAGGGVQENLATSPSPLLKFQPENLELADGKKLHQMSSPQF